VQSAQQLVDQNIGKFIQGPELEQYRYGRIADNLTKAGVQVSGGQLAALSKDEVLAIARQFVDFRDGINEMELAVLGAVGPLADLKDSAKDAADALNKQAQDLIDQNIGKLLSGADLQKYQYGRIAGNLAGANVNVSVDELMGLSRPDVIKATQALVDFSDGVSKAELTILEAGFALLDLKDASAAAADNFKGFGTRISSMSQIESAKQGYVDALGLAVKSEQFQADFDAGTLPKNLQDYVDSFPGGKDDPRANDKRPIQPVRDAEGGAAEPWRVAGPAAARGSGSGRREQRLGTDPRRGAAPPGGIGARADPRHRATDRLPEPHAR
jgi:hypothetical protein